MDTITLNKMDPDFKNEIAEKIGLQEIKPCYSCGSCTGVCPVREVVDDFDPRRLIHMIILGLRDQVLSSDLIWFCCQCNSCFFVGPRKSASAGLPRNCRRWPLPRAMSTIIL